MACSHSAASPLPLLTPPLRFLARFDVFQYSKLHRFHLGSLRSFFNVALFSCLFFAIRPPLAFLRNLASIDREYRNRHFSNSTFLSSKGRIDDTAVCQTFVASGIRVYVSVCVRRIYYDFRIIRVGQWIVLQTIVYREERWLGLMQKSDLFLPRYYSGHEVLSKNERRSNTCV